MAYKEFDIYDEDGFYQMMVPRRYSKFEHFSYVYLFKPSKNPKIRTKVVIRRMNSCLACRRPIQCEDGKTRVVSLVGDFYVAGNMFNQRGECLGSNNKGYFVRPLDYEFDHSLFDVKFTENDLIKAKRWI